MIALVTPLLGLLRPALPYLLGAAAILGVAGWLWLAGAHHVERADQAAQAQRQIETLEKERAGDAASTAVRRDGVGRRLRDGAY